MLTAVSFIAVAFALLWLFDVKPPDGTTDWITALSALGALGFAGVAGLATYGQLSVLKSEARQRAADAHNEQARLIYWSESVDGMTLYNVSTEPILNVLICLHAPGGDYFRFRMFELFPTGREGLGHPWVAAFQKAIRDRWAFTKFEAEAGLVGAYGGHPYRVDLVFMDSAGRRWHRDAGMALEEVAADYVPPGFELDHVQNQVHHPKPGVSRPQVSGLTQVPVVEMSWAD